VKRIVTLAVILGCALHLWLYNSVIVDTFFNAPAQLGAVVVGTFDPVSVVDQILFAGGDGRESPPDQGRALQWPQLHPRRDRRLWSSWG